MKYFVNYILLFYKNKQVPKHCCSIFMFFNVGKYYSKLLFSYVFIYQSIYLHVYLALCRYISIQNWAKNFEFDPEILSEQKDLNYGRCYHCIHSY